MHQAHTQFKIPVSVLCKRFGIPRASFYRQRTEKDRELLDRIKHIAFKHPSWGYRMIWAEFRKQGVNVNRKKLYRLYISANLQKPVSVSVKKHCKPIKPLEATKAEFPGHVWAGDFLHDRIVSGRAFRMFNVLDVFSRRGFEPRVEYSLPGTAIAEHLDNLCRVYGSPRVFRRDDGPEFRSEEFQKIIKKWRIREEVTPPGQPFNNGHIESYQGTMRDELLEREEFDTLESAQQKIVNWVKSYNTERPHSALRYRTPMEVWNEYYRL
ncbi:MAG: IS3 family transposase [Thermodesulforhabdaceae bacterium]